VGPGLESEESGASILGVGVATPRFLAEGRRGVARGRGCGGRVVKYYYILSCT